MSLLRAKQYPRCCIDFLRSTLVECYRAPAAPFGFQNEERTYWQAPEIYYKMSPFSYADKIKTGG